MNFGLAQAVVLLSTVLISGGSPAPKVDISSPPAYIMHAGGTIEDGRTGTNSLEAMNRSYEAGRYWLELDFNWTSDGIPVCIHDWDTFYTKNITGVPVPDSETFEQYRKTTYGYETPTLDMIAEWLWEHPGAVIVTDAKENNLRLCQYISQKYPHLMERFAIQIYSREEYEYVSGCGFDKIIYTFYREPYHKRFDVEDLRCFAEQNKKLIALVYGAEKSQAEEIAAVTSLAIPVYVHTVNDPAERAFWLSMGVSGFYSDYVTKP